MPTFTFSSLLYGIGATVGAAALGLIALNRGLLPQAIRRPTHYLLGASVEALRTAHSGHVGDYVAWLTVGLATFGIAFGVALSPSRAVEPDERT